jgi:hypothetical protein
MLNLMIIRQEHVPRSDNPDIDIHTRILGVRPLQTEFSFVSHIFVKSIYSARTSGAKGLNNLPSLRYTRFTSQTSIIPTPKHSWCTIIPEFTTYGSNDKSVRSATNESDTSLLALATHERIGTFFCFFFLIFSCEHNLCTSTGNPGKSTRARP